MKGAGSKENNGECFKNKGETQQSPLVVLIGHMVGYMGDHVSGQVGSHVVCHMMCQVLGQVTQDQVICPRAGSL